MPASTSRASRARCRPTVVAVGAALLAATACTRLGYPLPSADGPPPALGDAQPPTAQDGPRADRAADAAPLEDSTAAVDSSLALLQAELSPPSPVPGVNSPNFDDGPHLSADGLRLYFSSTRPGGSGGEDLWVATRATLSQGFAPPVPVPGVNSADEESDLWLSADELTIVFERTDQLDQIVFATRPDRGAAFSAPVPLPGVHVGDTDAGDPALSADLRTLVFSSERPGGRGSRDLWRAARAATGDAFSGVIPIDAANSPRYEADPFLLADGALLLFTAVRSDGPGKGDLYAVDLRPGATGPTLLAALSTENEESGAFVHEGLRVVIFESDRGGDFDLYWSTF